MLANKWTIIVTIVAVLLVTIGWQNHRLATEQRRAASLALRASNLEAERDTTREVERSSAAAARAFGDTVSAFTKRVIQTSQPRDAIDRALSAVHVASYHMAVRVDTVRLRAAWAEPGSNVQHAHYDLRQEPYSIAADIERVTTSDSGALKLAIALDPITVAARVHCGSANADGIRSASIAASTPRWASVRFERVEQSPDVCASPALRPSTTRHMEFAPFVVGVGGLMDRERASWGIFLGTGIRLHF